VVTRRAGALLSLVVALAIVATLVLTAPWSADERMQAGGEPRVDVLTLSRDLAGGKARFVGCKPHPHGRACELEGPTGKRATCLLFGGGEYSCFESRPGDPRR
jgi:hypothetical protein